ncbi:hypothetical protein E3N88_32528 [Mikania micrantha]|uniref:Uncharacterized protein n=1 Tax=Mikania micrantha TaxID=192012 RepID=A0A5N6MBB6_9ASTR|nr:hypothetical protein E3N88_32528 [Mikania micrantha]
MANGKSRMGQQRMSGGSNEGGDQRKSGCRMGGAYGFIRRMSLLSVVFFRSWFGRSSDPLYFRVEHNESFDLVQRWKNLVKEWRSYGGEKVGCG